MSDSFNYPPVAPVSIRDNYNIKVTSEQLMKLKEVLQEGSLVAPTVTWSVQKISQEQFLVQTVVGTVDPDNIYSGGAGSPVDVDSDMTTANQGIAFMEILDELEITYSVGKAVQVLGVQNDSNAANAFSRSISALTGAGISVISSYDSAVPYILPPIPTEDPTSGHSHRSCQVGVKGYIFHIPDIDASRAYHVLSGVVSACTTQRDKNSASQLKKTKTGHHHKHHHKRHRVVE